MNTIRAGLTETLNAFAEMPTSTAELPLLRDRLEDIRAANVDHHLDLITAAAERGVRVLGLGELFTAPYFALTEEPMWRDLAEDAHDGPTVRTLRDAARQHSMVLVAPIYERDAASGQRFNTAVVLDADGEHLGSYRKTHIPHGDNEQGSFRETFYYERGDGRQAGEPACHFPVFATAAGRIGVAICYDRHFEGVMSSLSNRGAEIVFSPAVTFGAVSKRMWPLEFAVDAARHRLFIGGSNRRGAEPPWNQQYFGRSHFCGPEGQLPNLSDHPNLVIADLDVEALRRPDAAGWDLDRDARPEIYRP